MTSSRRKRLLGRNHDDSVQLRTFLTPIASIPNTLGNRHAQSNLALRVSQRVPTASLHQGRESRTTLLGKAAALLLQSTSLRPTGRWAGKPRTWDELTTQHECACVPLREGHQATFRTNGSPTAKSHTDLPASSGRADACLDQSKRPAAVGEDLRGYADSRKHYCFNLQ